MELLTRIALAALISLSGIALYAAVSRLRVMVLSRRSAGGNALADVGLHAGTPAILYFTTPGCVPCRTTQRPAIAELEEQFGSRLQVVTVDASERSDLANFWGVLSVPTTFVIDADGRPRHVNNGVASASRLRQQLREFAGLQEPPDDGAKATAPVDQFSHAE
ncbi:MAG: thioredoxin family protein [Chloroflexi bacterium]|nr:thioredoxin family protein [Chloroflexota bacterium]